MMQPQRSLAAPAPDSVGVLPAASVVLTGLASAAIIVAMPGLLAAMSVSLGLASSQIALINSAEMGGITATTIAVAAWLDRLDRRGSALVGLALLVLANLLSAFATTFFVLLAARFVAGLAAGALQGIVSASIAATPIPDRLFAIYLTGNLTATTFMLGLLSRFTALGHPQWLFLTVGAMALLATVLLRWLPDGPSSHRASTGRATGHRLAHGIAALFGTFMLLVGIGLTWPLVGVLGLQRQLSGGAVAATLSFATTGGIAASVLVSAAGDRLGRLMPILMGMAGLGVAVLVLVLVHDATSFAVAAFLFMFCWVLILPYCAGLVAAIDPDGRLSVLWITMQFAGLATGPVIAAGLVPISADLPFYGALLCFGMAAAATFHAARSSRATPTSSGDFLP